jgi:hypothetical protein
MRLANSQPNFGPHRQSSRRWPRWCAPPASSRRTQAQREPEIQPDRQDDARGGVAIASIKRLAGRRHLAQLPDRPGFTNRTAVKVTVPSSLVQPHAHERN